MVLTLILSFKIKNRSFSLRGRSDGQPESDRIVFALVPRIWPLLQTLCGPTHEQHGGRQLEDRRRDPQSYVGHRRNPWQRPTRVSSSLFNLQ